MFGIKKLERKTVLLVEFGCFTQPEESRVGSEFCFPKHLGDQCGTGSRTQQRILLSGKEMMIRFQPLGGRCGVCERASTGRLVRGIENQVARTELDCTQYSNLRQKWNLPESEQIVDQKINVLIWGLFMSTAMKAAVHLGQNYKDNSVSYRNTNFEELKTLFDIMQKLILDQDFGILNVSTIEWEFYPGMRSIVLHDKVIRWAIAKVALRAY